MRTIRELRRDRGWTQFELALAVGVQPQTVYLWESGRRMPQVPQVRRLGEVFGICSDEIALEPRGHQAGPAMNAPGAGEPSSGGNAPWPESCRDYPREREDARVAHMSVADRAWEAASLQRNQDSIQQGDSLAAQRNVGSP